MIGIGYIMTTKEKEEMLRNVENSERFEEINSNFYHFSEKNCFFGEIIYEIPKGKAISLETIRALPALSSENLDFGLKYGSMLYDMGVDVDTINEQWCNPTIYIIKEDNL